MTEMEKKLRETGFFSCFDLAFARLLASREKSELKDISFLTAAMVSNELSRGHTCLLIEQWAGKELEDENEKFSEIVFPDEKLWLEQISSMEALNVENPPLVLSKKRLYLGKYRDFEKKLVSRMLSMVKMTSSKMPDREFFSHLFPEEKTPSYQKTAVFSALHQNLSIITGGPGTGKTTTVAKIILALKHIYPEFVISLAAPTGKAAARMNESMCNAREYIASHTEIPENFLENLDITGSTVHRLLGAGYMTHKFTYNSKNPLSSDTVIIDEASMMDISLFSRLMSALKKNSRLILIGDRDQLASVEAGAVLADVCEAWPPGMFSKKKDELYRSLFGEKPPGDISVSDNFSSPVTELKKSWRFEKVPAIGELSAAVNSMKKPAHIEDVFKQHGSNNIKFTAVKNFNGIRALIEKEAEEAYADLFKETSPEKKSEVLEKFRILSPVRRGQFGVEMINRVVEDMFMRKGFIHERSMNYDGKIIMIRKNSRQTELYNGDTGIISGDVCFFPSSGGGIKPVSKVRLPEHEPAYAVTVHKSQGSEYDRVLIIIPPEHNPIITKELIYTAITRARSSVHIAGASETLYRAVSEKVQRASGIKEEILCSIS